MRAASLCATAALLLLAGSTTAFPFPSTKWAANVTAAENMYNQYMAETTAVTQTTAFFANAQSVTAYAATTGSLKYTIAIPSTASAPALFAGPDEWLFFATNMSVYGYQAGVQKWTTRLPPLAAQQVLALSPDGTKLVAAFAEGYVVEVNTTNGGIIFQYLSSDVGDSQIGTAAYTWDSSIVVVWNPDQTIVAFDAVTGAGQWENNATQASLTTVVGSYVVVFGENDNGYYQLTVFDAATGVQAGELYNSYYAYSLIPASNSSVILISNNGVTAEYSVPGLVLQWQSNQWNLANNVPNQASSSSLLTLFNNQDLTSIGLGSGYLEWSFQVAPEVYDMYGASIGVSRYATKGAPLISFTMTYQNDVNIVLTSRRVMTVPNPAVVTEERCENAPHAKPCSVGCKEATFRTVCTSETPNVPVSYQTVWNAYRCAPGNSSVPIHVTHTRYTGQSCSGNPTYETVHYGGLCVIGDNFTASIVKDCFEPL